MERTFAFQKFTVRSNKSFPVGTDSLLLGALAIIPSNGKVLDIGTGGGVLALMAASRNAQKITAIDIDKEAVNEAKNNVLKSPYKDQIQVVNEDIIRFKESEFDTIICNPPYFNNQTKSVKNTTARHQNGLTFENLATKCAELLCENGTVNIVIPFDQYNNTLIEFANCGLYLCQEVRIKHERKSPVSLAILVFRKQSTTPSKNILVLYQNGERTEEYRNLVAPYLNI